MKKLMLILALMLTSSFLKADEFEKIIGSAYAPLNTERAHVFNHAIKVGDHYYLMGKKKQNNSRSLKLTPVIESEYADLMVYKLDSTLSVLKVSTIQGQIENKNVTPVTILEFNGQLMAYFYFNNRKSDIQYLFAQKIDLITLKTIGDPYKIAETSISFFESADDCQFKISVSPNKKWMFITTCRNYQPHYGIEFWQINTNLETVNFKPRFNLGKGIYSIIFQNIDNEGHASITGLEIPNQNESNPLINQHNMLQPIRSSRLLMMIAHPDKSIKEITFSNGDEFYSANVSCHPSSAHLILAGLKAKDKKGTNSIYSAEIDLAGSSIIKENETEFSIDLMNRINNLKPSKSVKDNFYYSSSLKTSITTRRIFSQHYKSEQNDLKYIPDLFNVNSNFIDENGDLVVVCQKFYILSIEYNSGKTNYYYEKYPIYGDVIIFKIDSSGSLKNYGYAFNFFVDDRGSNFYDKTIYSNNRLYLFQVNFPGEVLLNDTTTELGTMSNSANALDDPYQIYNFIPISKSEMMLAMSDRRKLKFSIVRPKN